jgi:pimeloyl-ACP methyl ester carboxylesterase
VSRANARRAQCADRFTVIFYDHRCNGRSTRAPVSSMTWENLTADADALRERLGGERWAVLGHSFGCRRGEGLRDCSRPDWRLQRSRPRRPTLPRRAARLSAAAIAPSTPGGKSRKPGVPLDRRRSLIELIVLRGNRCHRSPTPTSASPPVEPSLAARPAWVRAAGCHGWRHSARCWTGGPEQAGGASGPAGEPAQVRLVCLAGQATISACLGNQFTMRPSWLLIS